jgi:hypothetical protein
MKPTLTYLILRQHKGKAMQQVAVFRYNNSLNMWAINNYAKGTVSKTNKILNSWRQYINNPKTGGKYDYKFTLLTEDYRNKSFPGVDELIKRFDPIR